MQLTPEDIQSIKQKVNIVDVIGRDIGLKKVGKEMIGVCPFHIDSDPSLQVNEEKQIFKCFSCGASGDSIEFVQRYRGCSFKDAVIEVDSLLSLSSIDKAEFKGTFKKKKKTKKELANEWIPTCKPFPRMPNDEDLLLFKKDEDDKWVTKKPVAYWVYHDINGDVIAYACRFEYPKTVINETGAPVVEVKKEFRYLTYCENGLNVEKFKYINFPDRRPIYNLNLVKENPKHKIIICEGEKCAEAVTNAFYGVAIGVAWPNGANSLGKVDFEILKNRVKIIWPDNDSAGFKAVHQIMKIDKAESFRIYLPPEDAPLKWDAYDALEENDPEVVKAMVRDGLFTIDDFNKIDIEKRFAPKSSEQDFDEMYEDDGEQIFEDFEHHDEGNSGSTNDKWSALGYDRDKYYYFSYWKKQIVCLTPPSHKKDNLMQFASLTWWAKNFPGDKQAISWDAVVNTMMSQCHAVGIYDESRVRGLGAWMDDKKVIIHKGDSIISEGRRIPLAEFKSDFIYERDLAIPTDSSAPLSNMESSQFLEACKSLSFEDDMQCYYLAGWIVCAIIGGTLDWRPHFFITGKASSGKSFVMNQIVYKALGRETVQVMGPSTAAGVQGMIGNKSWPIWIDEFEAETQEAKRNFENILLMLRCSSTNTNAVVAKGRQDGSAREHHIRSCAIVSGIGANLYKHADVSRFTMGTLKKMVGNPKEVKARFKVLDEQVKSIITDEFCLKLRSRIYKLAPVIKKNTKIFKSAITEIMDSRQGDQLGAILAGARSLVSDKEISLEEARKWVESKTFEVDTFDTKADELRILTLLMSKTLQFEVKGYQIRRNMAEMIYLARDISRTYDSERDSDEMNFSQKDVRRSIQRFGFKVQGRVFGSDKKEDEERLLISCTHPEIEALLRNTPWDKNYSQQMGRLDGVIKVRSARFAESVQTAISIPMEYIDGQEELT